VRAAVCVLPPGERYASYVNLLNYGRWVGQNYGPIFRRLWTKVLQITSADAGEIAVYLAITSIMNYHIVVEQEVLGCM